MSTRPPSHGGGNYGWFDAAAEAAAKERAFAKAATRAEHWQTELGLPGWAASLSPGMHYEQALIQAQKLLKACGEADQHGMRARQMIRAVMEECAVKDRLHATHSLGHFGQRSLQCGAPNTTTRF